MPTLALLEIDSVTVRFGGLQALHDVSLGVAPGRVTGLIGPNGAGKTTLFNVITGLQPPTGGRILLAGEDISGARPHLRARKGLARTFQRLEVFGTLTVFENVLVAAEMRRAWAREPEVRRARPAEVTAEALARVGLAEVSEKRVDALPTGTARLVEVARALVTRPRVLLLDEPSAGLDVHEVVPLSDLLRQLAASGLAVLLVEHDMAMVMSTCDEIHVLDFGRIIASGTPAEVQVDPAVRAAYLGSDDRRTAHQRTRSNTHVRPRSPGGDPGDNGGGGARPQPVLELRAIHAAYGSIAVLHGVDLAVGPGEVLALLGPNGAGKSTTLKVASGRLVPTSGALLLCGHRVERTPADALARAGLCSIPEGRGVFPNLTVAENLRMATFTGTRSADVEARAYARFPVLERRHTQLAGTLSGGEQQMLAMARALATDPAVLLVDELSMGLGPTIVEQLYESVRAIAEEGLSLVLVEQLAHEVLGVADVAALMLGGRVARVGPPDELAEDLAGAYLGGAVTGATGVGSPN